MMKEYEFTLKFTTKEKDSSIHIDKLYDAGCNDATIGIATPYHISLCFLRQSNSAYYALSSAIDNVKSAIPDSKLVMLASDCLQIEICQETLIDNNYYIHFNKQ